MRFIPKMLAVYYNIRHMASTNLSRSSLEYSGGGSSSRGVVGRRQAPVVWVSSSVGSHNIWQLSVSIANVDDVVMSQSRWFWWRRWQVVVTNDD